MSLCHKCKKAVGAWPGWSGHYRGCTDKSVHRGKRGLAQVGVEGEHIEHAMAEGWFDFPYNFDPTWIESCKSFEPVD